MRASVGILLLAFTTHILGEETLLNDYIDKVLGNAASANITLSLPDIEKSINQTSAINLYKSYEITNGKLDKLHNFVRSKNATLSYNSHVAQLNAGFEFTDLLVTYDFEVVGDYQFLTLSGSLEGSIQGMNVTFDLSGNTETLQLEAKTIEFDNPGKISLQLKTGTLTQGILNALLNFATSHFESEILEAVQNAIKNAINSHFTDVKSQLLEIR